MGRARVSLNDVTFDSGPFYSVVALILHGSILTSGG